MKTQSLTTVYIALGLLISIASFGQSKNVEAIIKVYGNCSMCKQRIETALDQKGIKQASWDTKTKQLQVVYTPSKISEQEIHQLIAAVGHDTDKVKAKDEVYADLPFCCLYRDHDHNGAKSDPHKSHN